MSRKAQDQANRIARKTNQAISEQLLIFVREVLKKPNLRGKDVEFFVKRSPYEITIQTSKLPVEGKFFYRLLATRDNIIIDNRTFSIN